MLDTVLGTGDIAVNKTKSSPLWSWHSSTVVHCQFFYEMSMVSVPWSMISWPCLCLESQCMYLNSTWLLSLPPIQFTLCILRVQTPFWLLPFFKNIAQRLLHPYLCYLLNKVPLDCHLMSSMIWLQSTSGMLSFSCSLLWTLCSLLYLLNL